MDSAGWPDLAGDPGEQVPLWRGWLARNWADTAFARAVETAGPDLAHRVTAIRAGHEHRARQARGAVVSVLRYRLRASSRATPFGLFAGVAPAAFGPATMVRLGDEHRATARVDAAWLAGVVTKLEHRTELADRLPVVVNNAATVATAGWSSACVRTPRPLRPAPTRPKCLSATPARSS